MNRLVYLIGEPGVGTRAAGLLHVAAALLTRAANLLDRPESGGRPPGSEHHPAGRRSTPLAVPTPRLRLVPAAGKPWHPTRYRHSRNQAP